MIESLERFVLFNDLPMQALEKIADLAHKETYPDGSVLFNEDASALNFYLILSGKVSLEKLVQLGRTGTPRRASISIICPGQALGWSSLVAPYKYTSSGICLEKTTVLVIPGEELRSLMADLPSVGFILCQRIASIIRGRMTSATSTLTYFLSIVSHELKRPMAAVENYFQVLLGGYAGELNDKQTRLVERSSIRLNDLRSLIDDILDFARMQPDQIRADFIWVNPSEICAEAIEEVRLAATQKNIYLKTIGTTEFQPLVAARRRFRQALSNILANAVKFSPEGGMVTLIARDEPERLVVEVLDEGIGIPAEDQPHIFEDFFRAGNVAEFGGAGLGLSITKKIVEAHQGQIEVESPYAPNKSGTKVTIIIPRSLSVPGDIRLTKSDVEQKISHSSEEASSLDDERDRE